MKIQQLPNDIMITGLSHLSRGKGYKDWLIGVNYKHKTKLRDKSEFKNLKFSNMPMLVKGRIYNATEPANLYYKKANFTIQNLSYLASLDDFCFEAIIDINYEKQSYKQVKVKISKLELARVLFFHNSYLASSALQERALDIDFTVKKENGKNIITVLQHCPLAKTLFEDMGFRSKLAWLLLSPAIKNSYCGIYQNLFENQTTDKDYYKSTLDFTPPALTNLNFEVRGYLNDKRTLYVDEIFSIKGIDSGITGDVEFQGDLFTQELTAQCGTEISTQPNNTKEPSISDEHEANSDAPVQIIETPQVAFEFLDPIYSLIKPSRTTIKTGVQSKNDESSDDINDLDTLTVATNEATTVGNVPKGEFQNAEDTTNRDTQYRQNFAALIEAIEKLNLDNLSFFYHELPRVPRCKLYRKLDGNFRILLQAKFLYNGQPFSAFEIDTTDLEKKRLSTLIVRDNYEVVDFNSLLKEVVRTSLTWSKMPFTQKVNLPHPKDFYTGTFDSEAMINTWSQRIENSLNQLISNE